MNTLSELYLDIKKRFRDAGFDTPELDAKTLLSFALGVAPEDVLLKPDTPVRPNTVLDDAVARRLAHEPVSKITGMRGFYGLEFEVTKDVLDPRADTETLVDAARKGMNPDVRILDICTGSGCIPLALLSAAPLATAVAVDVSAAALDIARRNAARLGLSDRIVFRNSDWLENVEGTFDVVTCNPPYIPSADIAGLDAGVRLHDPLLALDGGADGLLPYRILFPQIRKYLAAGGRAYFEFGQGQANDITRLAAGCGLQVNAVLRDLGGIERVVCLQ